MASLPDDPDDLGTELVLSVDLHGDGTTMLRLEGDVDHSHQSELQTVIDMLERHRPRELRIDVSRVTFTDSTLVDLAAHARSQLGRRGGVVWVVDPPAHVRRVFALLDASDLLDGVGTPQTTEVRREAGSVAGEHGHTTNA